MIVCVLATKNTQHVNFIIIKWVSLEVVKSKVVGQKIK